MCFTLFNETSCLQALIIFTLTIYPTLTNILVSWYIAGLYLIFIGCFLLIKNSEIFVGFLWVIDFGVGLIFFIFILHFTNFLHQKVLMQIFDKKDNNMFIFILNILFIAYFIFCSYNNKFFSINKIWVFLLSWYNFYEFYLNYYISMLQLLREIYFYNNSFEFVIVNFMLLYGIIISVILTFLIKIVFVNSTVDQFKKFSVFKKTEAVYFIRQQNFLKQQNTSTGSRIWKKKNFKHDF